ncbi:hypothetical protein C7974DRAFT_72385 [Boeremia exigua]|uniref:uncharacterized protein n=1 Tax=Boeremia exigua TaxID=749465 RepID=UPI001E8D7993|nr:uncharacterized protein C7974DRAFT_72385 [Boeremia exigua]KAH6614183.1 hypothetical protein C7974DRAFT_72385 [Boeremia exigua]
MVNSLLFRWEDSQALQHHCGFCERPLSHPGARASCFGTHSEPCHRFHQAMFMRNRAHMCNYCTTIDEAHYKRHHELVIQLRKIYESCGEADWTIPPVEPDDIRRSHSYDLHPTACDNGADSLAPDETPISKRDRKDAKSLARAANRVKVVTQDEIRYVESVLHSAEGVSGGESTSPANLEELQLIEEQLRYNANVYNLSSHRDLKRFAKIPDVEVDFDGEMERVLATFRITELVKRNVKNRGLQGKDLTIFENLVETFKSAVVEDLVLVKKDMMEVQMRRAGYLRYTSKAAYNIVEDRYTDKDWKTGERITASNSDSSGLDSLVGEPAIPYECEPTIPSLPVLPSVKGPDQRHLLRVHTRISGDDGLGQKVIEPYHTPLLPLAPKQAMRKPAVLQLKVVENKENQIPAGMTNRGWLRRGVTRQSSSKKHLRTSEEEHLSHSALSEKPFASSETRPMSKSTWGSSEALTQGSMAERATEHEEVSAAPHERVEPLKRVAARSSAPAVQLPMEHENVGLQGPEGAISPNHDTRDAHPVVSQKKAKKAQREAKRKAKKVSIPEETANPTAVDPVGLGVTEQVFRETLLDAPLAKYTSHAMEDVSPLRSSSLSRDLADGDKDNTDTGLVAKQNNDPGFPIELTPPTILHTTHGKHNHWARFSSAFIVDRLTSPLLQSLEACSPGSSCLFESHGVLDCPFHEPRCDCGDPLLIQCYLMHPGKELYTSGPYNQAHGKRLLAMYEQHDITKGRLMLVDEDLVSYLLDRNSSPDQPDPTTMPTRLLREHFESLNGYGCGPLMQTELEFERRLAKDVSIGRPLTSKILQNIQGKHSGLKGSRTLCYCQVEVLPHVRDMNKEFGKDFVSCSYRRCEFGGVFHTRCVKKLGSEKVSRWYCTSCEKQMKVLACRTLKVPGNEKAATFDGTVGQLAKVFAAEMVTNRPKLNSHF